MLGGTGLRHYSPPASPGAPEPAGVGGGVAAGRPSDPGAPIPAEAAGGSGPGTSETLGEVSQATRWGADAPRRPFLPSLPPVI